MSGPIHRSQAEIASYLKGFVQGLDFGVKRLLDYGPPQIDSALAEFRRQVKELQRELFGLRAVAPKLTVHPPPEGHPDWLHFLIAYTADMVGPIPLIDEAELCYDDWRNELNNLRAQLDKARTELANLHSKFELRP